MTTETAARYLCSAAALVSGAGLALSVPWAVPPALVWVVLLVVFGGCAIALWRRHFEAQQNERDRERYQPDQPYRQRPDQPYQASKDEPQY